MLVGGRIECIPFLQACSPAASHAMSNHLYNPDCASGNSCIFCLCLLRQGQGGWALPSVVERELCLLRFFCSLARPLTRAGKYSGEK